MNLYCDSLIQARDGTLAIEDMDGGTFTISNGGVFGSMFGTPIINPPQSAILGMHATFDRPVAIDGKVSVPVYVGVHILHMYIVGTCEHTHFMCLQYINMCMTV